jgi:hypothetical protein
MISNRREMLCQAAGALAGLASIGCGLVSPAFAQMPQRRREVVVNGKRVRTVDLHAHCHVPEANALMWLKVQLQSLVVSSERIKVMDGDDLLDAQAAIDWAATQIPILQSVFFEWCKEHPYKVVKELDSQRGGYVLVAYPDGTFPPIHNAWVGLSSIRCEVRLIRSLPHWRDATAITLTLERTFRFSRLNRI